MLIGLGDQLHRTGHGLQWRWDGLVCRLALLRAAKGGMWRRLAKSPLGLKGRQ